MVLGVPWHVTYISRFINILIFKDLYFVLVVFPSKFQIYYLRLSDSEILDKDATNNACANDQDLSALG